jgi:hypothetical protein
MTAMNRREMIAGATALVGSLRKVIYRVLLTSPAATDKGRWNIEFS